MNSFEEIENLPDISFIDELTLEDIQNQLIEDYMFRYKEITGEDVTMIRSDPYRLILQACGVLLFQTLLFVDRAGKQGMLKYSYDAYLDNLAALKGIRRKEPANATTTVKFTVSEAIETEIVIQKGTRVTNGMVDVYFLTDETALIPPGETEAEITCTCSVGGIEGNGFAPGEINTLVDPVGYIESVANIYTTAGGADLEDDDSLAQRIFLAPSSYSVAGPDDAYEYWVKNYNQEIGDVRVTSPAPGKVDIRFIMRDGSLPDDGIIEKVMSNVSQKGKRPLTDLVQVRKPDIEEYRLKIKYFINASDRSHAFMIRENVAGAIREYINWQGTKIGRDINPDELIARIKNAGAKRVEVSEPAFRAIEDIKIALCTEQSITYGGIEDD